MTVQSTADWVISRSTTPRSPAVIERAVALGLGGIISADVRSALGKLPIPVLSRQRFAALDRRAAERLGETMRPPAWPDPEEGINTSAAWLIERAGFHRGFGEGRAGI